MIFYFVCRAYYIHTYTWTQCVYSLSLSLFSMQEYFKTIYRQSIQRMCKTCTRFLAPAHKHTRTHLVLVENRVANRTFSFLKERKRKKNEWMRLHLVEIAFDSWLRWEWRKNTHKYHSSNRQWRREKENTWEIHAETTAAAPIDLFNV